MAQRRKDREEERHRQLMRDFSNIYRRRSAPTSVAPSKPKELPQVRAKAIAPIYPGATNLPTPYRGTEGRMWYPPALWEFVSPKDKTNWVANIRDLEERSIPYSAVSEPSRKNKEEGETLSNYSHGVMGHPWMMFTDPTNTVKSVRLDKAIPGEIKDRVKGFYTSACNRLGIKDDAQCKKVFPKLMSFGAVPYDKASLRNLTPKYLLNNLNDATLKRLTNTIEKLPNMVFPSVTPIK